jgi:hypothetical protein
MKRSRLMLMSGLLSLPFAAGGASALQNPVWWTTDTPGQREFDATENGGYEAKAHVEARGPWAGVHNGETYLRMVENKVIDVEMTTNIQCGSQWYYSSKQVGPDASWSLANSCGTELPAATMWSAQLKIIIN